METVASVCYLLAGSDVVIVRHPESARIIRSFIDLMINGGMASGVHGVSKKIDIPEADLISVSPEPNLDFGGAEISSNAETEKVKRKAAAKSKKDEKRPTPKKEEMVVHKKPEQEPEPKVDKTDESKAEARVKAEEEARVKAEAETKAKAKEEARVKAKEEAEAKATMKAKESEALRELRNKRAQEREKHGTDRRPLKNQDILKNPAKDQPDLVGRLIKNLDHIHKRN
jgi:acetyl-CoA decarbonylase/synthase complex subunit delta